MGALHRSSPIASVRTVALLLLLSACATAPPRADERPPPDDPGLVTRQEIEASGARSVWDALRLTVSLHVADDVRGEPAILRHRGHESIVGSPSPILVMDGAILRDFRHLDELPAEDLVSIQVRPPSYAVARYGSLARAGVVELRTRRD